MTTGTKPNKITRKTIKKLGPWVQKLKQYGIFQLGRNARYGLPQFLELPLAAAVNNRSIEDQSLLEGRVSADDFYHHANSKLSEENIRKMFIRYVHEIIKLLNNLLHRSSFFIAIDKTDDPYWGEHENLFVTGGKRKQSTNYAFRYLTAAIVVQGIEFILYARPLTKEDRADAPLVEECLYGIRALGIHVTRVLMDREFYNSEIIHLCNYLDIEYVIPLVKNSKFERWFLSFPRLPVLVSNYEVNGAVTNLLVMEDTNSKGEKEIYGFITNIDSKKIMEDPDSVAEFYRKRWAIENANKFQDAFMAHTNSTNGIVRYFFFVLAALLHNFWVLVSLLGKTFFLGKVSLNMFKDLAKALFGFAKAPCYKHAQRKLWVKLLLG